MPLRAGILTLGCKVNQYESRAMAELLRAEGIQICPFDTVCDLYLIHSCTVTAESDRKVRQMIRRAVKRNPAAVVAVCGCAVQKDPAALASIQGVSLLCGNGRKTELIRAAIEQLHRGKPQKPVLLCGPLDQLPYESMSITGFDRVRAYVKIEDGCSARCAYCIIPSVRGPVRSRPASEVLAEIETLLENGCREVILTGIETAAYQYGLAGLMEQIDQMEGIERIRLSSMDPAALKPELIDRIAALTHFMPHFHVSLQSGSSRTLAGMRRRYNAQTAMEHLRYIRQIMPQVQFSADVIVGFPGETDEDFAQTMDFITEIPFLHLHIFPYSRRPGTEAADMPGQIAQNVKATRAAQLATRGQAVRDALLSARLADGSPLTVLAEEKKGNFIYGHSEAFFECRMECTSPQEEDLRGQLIRVLPVSAADGVLCVRPLT